MKEMNDDELQQWLENKHPLQKAEELNDNARAYRMLFDALGKEPAYGLPYDFTAKVTRRIEADVKRSNELRWNLVAAAIFIAVIGILWGSMAMISPAITKSLLQYKWALLLLPLVFIAIQYFDQKLVKTTMFKGRSYEL